MNFSEVDFFWMKLAIKLANYAYKQNEVPIGAVIVKNNKLIGIGWNQPISLYDPTAHAEVNAIRDAAFNLGNYRLTDTTLYVTLEPCNMCLGAIEHARCNRVVFGAYDSKKDKSNSILVENSRRFKYEGGILEDLCATILKNFFLLKRI